MLKEMWLNNSNLGRKRECVIRLFPCRRRLVLFPRWPHCGNMWTRMKQTGMLAKFTGMPDNLTGSVCTTVITPPVCSICSNVENV